MRCDWEDGELLDDAQVNLRQDRFRRREVRNVCDSWLVIGIRAVRLQCGRCRFCRVQLKIEGAVRERVEEGRERGDVYIG